MNTIDLSLTKPNAPLTNLEVIGAFLALYYICSIELAKSDDMALFTYSLLFYPTPLNCEFPYHIPMVQSRIDNNAQ